MAGQVSYTLLLRPAVWRIIARGNSEIAVSTDIQLGLFATEITASGPLGQHTAIVRREPLSEPSSVIEKMADVPRRSLLRLTARISKVVTIAATAGQLAADCERGGRNHLRPAADPLPTFMRGSPQTTEYLCADTNSDVKRRHSHRRAFPTRTQCFRAAV